MGTDYFVVDVERKHVKYVDRMGTWLVCSSPWPERREVEGWLYGPSRVLSVSSLRCAKGDIEDETNWPGREGALKAVAWCSERMPSTLLVIDDSSNEDESAADFCHLVVFGDFHWREGDERRPKPEGWTGEDC